MKHRTSEILYSYWNEVRQGRLAPRRFDIEPAKISAILAETMILEHTGPASYRFRLAGTRIVDRFGRELRGTDFLDLWRSEDRERVLSLLEQLAHDGGCGLLTFEGETTAGDVVPFEAVVLPLIHTRDVVDRYLGAISSSVPLSWLEGHPVVSLRLLEERLVVAEEARVELLQADWMRPSLALNPAIVGGRIVRVDRRQFRVLDGGLSNPLRFGSDMPDTSE